QRRLAHVGSAPDSRCELVASDGAVAVPDQIDEAIDRADGQRLDDVVSSELSRQGVQQEIAEGIYNVRHGRSLPAAAPIGSAGRRNGSSCRVVQLSAGTAFL